MINMSIDYLNEIFEYKNGKIFRKYNNNKLKEVKTIIANGYISTTIKLKRFYAHRIIYAMFNKDFDILDSKIQVDHKDRVKTNNNIDNLRLVTHQENQFNRSNTKGYVKQRNKYIAQIYLNKKRIYIGSYDTEVEASNAYKNKKKEIHLFKGIEDVS